MPIHSNGSFPYFSENANVKLFFMDQTWAEAGFGFTKPAFLGSRLRLRLSRFLRASPRLHDFQRLRLWLRGLPWKESRLWLQLQLLKLRRLRLWFLDILASAHVCHGHFLLWACLIWMKTSLSEQIAHSTVDLHLKEIEPIASESADSTERGSTVFYTRVSSSYSYSMTIMYPPDLAIHKYSGKGWGITVPL